MPELCGAKNRRGEPCRRFRLKGKTRCKLHGGASTGPKTAKGKRRQREVLEANHQAAVTHGAARSFASYAAALAFGQEDEFKRSPADVDLGPELRFTRAKLQRVHKLLGEIERREGEGWRLLLAERITLGTLYEQSDRLVGRIAQLAATQHEVNPGGNVSGELRVTVNVVGAAAPAPEQAQPAPADEEGA